MSIVEVLGCNGLLFILGVREVNVERASTGENSKACLFATSEECQGSGGYLTPNPASAICATGGSVR